jgi:zeta-carotene desaturase
MVRYRQGGTVAIMGGGLAGLSAACALSDAGFRVSVFERRPYLGGRASSYEHPATGEIIDNCQHVLLGCCTNLLDFFTRIGVADRVRWYDQLTFVEPGGRRSHVAPSFLPAPFHSAPSFLWASSLELKDKIAIASAMALLIERLPEDTAEDFLSWLRRHHQTENAIRRFWKVVLVSALNEDLDRISVRYAAQVFRESFLKSPEGARMGVPTSPLTEMYEAAGEYLRARGSDVSLRTSVDTVRAEVSRVGVCLNGREEWFDFAVSAVPFDVLDQILPDASSVTGLKRNLARFETSPITGIHLWFDREITDLDHAVLLDRTIQWMFHKSRLLRRPGGSYLELVVSSSRSLLELGRTEIVELALCELGDFFPEVAEAKLLKSAVVKEVHATYSALPQSELYRPGPVTVWPRLLLAGDWTATGWPATMEGAVRSGYRAAEAITQMAGRGREFLVPDMPATGFMRIFTRLPIRVVS